MAAGLTRALRGFGYGRGIALLMLLALIALRALDPPLLEAVRLRTFDFYQTLKPREKTPLPVRIVDIDEASLAYLGQWPWPRNVLADMLASISRLGGVAVAFDVLFTEEDRLSPDAFARSLPGLSSEASQELLAMPSTDRVFADQMARSRVVLAQSGIATAPKSDRETALQTTSIANIGGDPSPYLIRYLGMTRNIPLFHDNAMGHGMISTFPDVDGIIRRVPLIMAVGDTVQPALSIELLRVATGQTTFATKRDEAGIRSVVVGGVEIPTDRRGRLWVYYTPHDPDRYVSAQALFRGEVPRERIANHLILVGTSSVGLLDIKSTPLEPFMPGVEVHAQLLETILSQNYLVRPNYALGAEIVAAAIVTLGIIILVPVLGALPVLIVGFLVAAGLAGGAWYMFAEQRMLFDVVYPLVTSFMVFMTLVFLNYRREELQRRQIRGAFGQYVAPAMVEQLARDPERLQLGGETRTLTVLFSDVRGFTAISESYKSDPHGLTELMNRFLTPLSNAIIENNGTIDKYMGDAVMAFWNAPLDDADHAANACIAALEMIDRVDALNMERRTEAEAEGRAFLPLNVGIGINTGEAVVGNMGSQMRFDYSVLGDSVNLASRLEGQSKTYGFPIILGAETAAMVADRFALAEIDLIRVKGKQEPERVFTLLGDAGDAGHAGFAGFQAANERLLAAYRAQDWGAVGLAMADAGRHELRFPADGYLALYEERIAAFADDPPPADWDGVFTATTK